MANSKPKAERTKKIEPKEKPVGYVFGRPTKYKAEYCETAIELLSQGHSLYAVADACDVSIDTIFEWRNTHQDFSEAIKRGQAKSAVWWEKRAQEFAETGIGNATAIIFGLKNRAKIQWNDETKIEHSGGVKVIRPTFEQQATTESNECEE